MLSINNSLTNSDQSELFEEQQPIFESLLAEPGELPRLELLLDLNDNFYQPTDSLFVFDGWQGYFILKSVKICSSPNLHFRCA